MRQEVDTRARLAVIGLVVVALFAGLVTRLWFLQVSGGESLAVAAQSNSDEIVQVPALRGRILDAKGRVLAETKPVTTLVVERQRLSIDQRARLVPALANVLAIAPQEVEARLDNKNVQPFEAVTVAAMIDDDQAQYVWEHPNAFPRTRVTSTYQRVYPQGTLAAHVVGYTGRINVDEYKASKSKGYAVDDEIGKTGIEQTFESELRGKPELKRVRVDNRGLKTGESMIRSARPGHDVQLSIDIDAQRVAEDSLQQGMDGARRLVSPDIGGFFEANGGAVVILDARTGAVAALASAPTFDPNQISMGGAPPSYFDPNGELPLIDRALSSYPPGSTFKLFSSMATLQSGVRAPDETIYDDGCIEFGDSKRCNAAQGEVRLRRSATSAHRVERRVLLQRRQGVLGDLPGRGQQRRARPPAWLRDPARGAGVRLRDTCGDRARRRPVGPHPRPLVQPGVEQGQ